MASSEILSRQMTQQLSSTSLLSWRDESSAKVVCRILDLASKSPSSMEEGRICHGRELKVDDGCFAGGGGRSAGRGASPSDKIKNDRRVLMGRADLDEISRFHAEEKVFLIN